MGLRARLQTAKLMVVADATRPDAGAVVRAAMDGGADLVELRAPQRGLLPGGLLERRTGNRHLVDVLDELLPLAQQHRVGLVVGHDVAAARRLGADFLHLAAGDEVAPGRAAVQQHGLVGRSVHHAAELDQAQGLDFLVVGPAEPGHLELVRQAARRHPATGDLPWFAAGGITPSRLDEVLAAGAVRVAVGRAITHADDPRAVTEQFAERLRELWRSPELERKAISSLGGGTLRFVTDPVDDPDEFPGPDGVPGGGPGR